MAAREMLVMLEWKNGQLFVMPKFHTYDRHRWFKKLEIGEEYCITGGGVMDFGPKVKLQFRMKEGRKPQVLLSCDKQTGQDEVRRHINLKDEGMYVIYAKSHEFEAHPCSEFRISFQDLLLMLGLEPATVETFDKPVSGDFGHVETASGEDYFVVTEKGAPDKKSTYSFAFELFKKNGVYRVGRVRIHGYHGLRHLEQRQAAFTDKLLSYLLKEDGFSYNWLRAMYFKPWALAYLSSVVRVSNESCSADEVALKYVLSNQGLGTYHFSFLHADAPQGKIEEQNSPESFDELGPVVHLLYRYGPELLLKDELQSASSLLESDQAEWLAKQAKLSSAQELIEKHYDVCAAQNGKTGLLFRRKDSEEPRLAAFGAIPLELESMFRRFARREDRFKPARGFAGTSNKLVDALLESREVDHQIVDAYPKARSIYGEGLGAGWELQINGERSIVPYQDAAGFTPCELLSRIGDDLEFHLLGGNPIDAEQDNPDVSIRGEWEVASVLKDGAEAHYSEHSILFPIKKGECKHFVVVLHRGYAYFDRSLVRSYGIADNLPEQRKGFSREDCDYRQTIVLGITIDLTGDFEIRPFDPQKSYRRLSQSAMVYAEE